MKTAAQYLLVLPLLIVGAFMLIPGILVLLAALLVSLLDTLVPDWPVASSWWVAGILLTAGGGGLVIVGNLIKKQVEQTASPQTFTSNYNQAKSDYSYGPIDRPDVSPPAPGFDMPASASTGSREPGPFSPLLDSNVKARDLPEGSSRRGELEAEEVRRYTRHETDERPSTWGW